MDEVKKCWCVTCWEAENDKKSIITDYGIIHPIGRPFIVCPDCGNKRCPKATHHDNACTGSNDVGQKGSIYGGLDDNR